MMEDPIQTEKTRTVEISETTKEFLIAQAKYYSGNGGKVHGDNKDPLYSLLSFYESHRAILTRLQLPWDKCNSIVHMGSILCLDKEQGKEARKKLITRSTDIINNFTFMAQNRMRIDRFISFYDNQIEILRAMLDELPETSSDTQTDGI